MTVTDASLADFTARQFKGALARVQLDMAVLEHERGGRHDRHAKWRKLKRMETILQLAIYAKERDQC